MTHRIVILLTGASIGGLLASSAFAEDQAPAAAAPAAAAPAPPSPALQPFSDAWVKTVKLSGHVEVGGTVNPTSPKNGINFGSLFTDKSNTALLNSAAMTLERDLDPKSTGFDLGFKVQGYFGSDARFTHFIGEFDRSLNELNQFDIVEANVVAHLPVLTAGGIDVKIGQFSTPIGAEVIDPTGDFFYSHDYIFNFGIPFKHTGILTTTHVNPILDVYAGYTTGVNTSIGHGGGSNNAQFHFLGGIGLNLNKLTVLAFTHIGPEDPAGSLGPGVDVHSKLRYIFDGLATYKFNDKLTSITEINYIHDDGFSASGGGVAQYLTYALTPVITAGVRGEVWRDAQGFFVAAFPGNLDYARAAVGSPNGAYGAGPATYGAITVGLNIKPPHLPKIIDGTVIRPEIRYDRALAGGTPFNGNPGIDKGQFTIAVDLVAPITF